MKSAELLSESTKLVFVAFMGGVMGVIVNTYMTKSNQTFDDGLAVLGQILFSIFVVFLVLWVFEKTKKR